MTPDFGIRDVAKRWPVDIDDEVPSRACDDDDLVSTVLSDPVKRVDKFRVAFCVHNARAAVTMELDNQHALGVPRQFQLAIGGEIVRLSCLHGICPLMIWALDYSVLPGKTWPARCRSSTNLKWLKLKVILDRIIYELR